MKRATTSNKMGGSFTVKKEPLEDGTGRDRHFLERCLTSGKLLKAEYIGHPMQALTNQELKAKRRAKLTLFPDLHEAENAKRRVAHHDLPTSSANEPVVPMPLFAPSAALSLIHI